jgi:hypothetical protein
LFRLVEALFRLVESSHAGGLFAIGMNLDPHAAIP